MRDLTYSDTSDGLSTDLRDSSDQDPRPTSIDQSLYHAYTYLPLSCDLMGP